MNRVTPVDPAWTPHVDPHGTPRFRMDKRHVGVHGTPRSGPGPLSLRDIGVRGPLAWRWFA